MAVRAIVFDFDGVLADSEPLHLKAYQAILEPEGIHLDTKTYCERYLGYDDEGSIRQVVKDFGLLLADEEIEVLLAEKARIFEKLVSNGEVLYPGAAACVRRLGVEWGVGIATGGLGGGVGVMGPGRRVLDVCEYNVQSG